MLPALTLKKLCILPAVFCAILTVTGDGLPKQRSLGNSWNRLIMFAGTYELVLCVLFPLISGLQVIQ